MKSDRLNPHPTPLLVLKEDTMNTTLPKALAANVLLAVIVACTIGGFLLLDFPEPIALLAGAIALVLVKLDDARIRRNRRKAVAA